MSENPGWNLTTAMADDAIDYMQPHQRPHPGPALLHLLRARRHARARTTRRRSGSRRSATCTCSTKGWNKLRETIFANQKKLGVIPQDAKLTPWPKDLLKEWDQLTADEKKLFIRQVDVFAAYVAYTDHEIGRVIQAIEDMGKLDNTLIIYISGDNGTSAEGTLDRHAQRGRHVQRRQSAGRGCSSSTSTTSGAPTRPTTTWRCGWAWAFDTPFSWTKQIASHFGGIRQGMAISWPKVIKDKGGIRHQFHHVIDVVPTILRGDRDQAPEVVDGIKQTPIEGVSMMYTFDKKNANAPSTHKTQYFEMFGDHAIYHDGWIASTKVMRPPWDVTAGAEGSDELPVGAVRPEEGLDPDGRPCRQEPCQAQGVAGALLEGGEEVPGAAARHVGGRRA